MSLIAWGKKLLLSLSVFLPSCSGSAYQMAVNWRDGYQGDLSPWWFWQLCFCSVWGRCPAERGEQTLRCAQLSAQVHFLWPLNRKFSGLLVRPWISSAVADFPGFLNLSLNVCSQVLGGVYTEVLEAAHPLHRGPTDHKRSVGLLLSLPEVHDQLFSFAQVQRETVVLAPWWK